MSNSIIQLHNTDPESFKNEIVGDIAKRLEDLEKRLLPQNNTWITRNQASEMLGVSLMTIRDWTKKDILKAYRIGSRIRFKLQEIEEVLNSSRYAD